MREKPTVSIVLPTYNNATLLPKAIESILQQSFQNFELIIINDCSSDNTEHVVETFVDKRIVYLKNDINKGAPVSRNIGINASRGEYIAFTDDDDIWFPQKLEKQMKLFSEASTKVGVVYSGRFITDSGKTKYFPSRKLKPKEGMIHQDLLARGFVANSTILAKREYLDKAGYYDPNFPRLQEWELMIRVSKYCSFRYINEPLVTGRKGIISSNIKALLCAQKMLFKKHKNEIMKNNKTFASHLYGIAATLYRMGDSKNGQKYLHQSLVTYPWCIDTLVFFMLSKFGLKFMKYAVIIKRKVFA